jgi:hypothetical protein
VRETSVEPLCGFYASAIAARAAAVRRLRRGARQRMPRRGRARGCVLSVTLGPRERQRGRRMIRACRLSRCCTVAAARRRAGGSRRRRILVVPFETPAATAAPTGSAKRSPSSCRRHQCARARRDHAAVRERAYDQLHLPPNAVLSRATVIKVGELVGAAQVIVGEVASTGTR